MPLRILLTVQFNPWYGPVTVYFLRPSSPFLPASRLVFPREITGPDLSNLLPATTNNFLSFFSVLQSALLRNYKLVYHRFVVYTILSLFLRFLIFFLSYYKMYIFLKGERENVNGNSSRVIEKRKWKSGKKGAESRNGA